MNREPIFSQKAREALSGVGETATAVVVVLGAFTALASVVVLTMLARIAPYIVAVFAGIILARCTGVM
ncbi:hypothetical protein [Hyphomicrobium sulfonivorans]|uniref:hypothetical protein n=1 Tax=Hyphomicrobium sulfonivorans TaxID=121290 RepID=UPI000837BD59|nr:hypothetical protein [Hyphomicrobium sulfonivorans]